MKKMDSFLERFLDLLTILILVAMVLIIVLQIICRVFKQPITWTEEIARYSFLVLIFFGAAQATRNKTHIRIEIFANRLKGRVGRAVKILVEVLVGAFLCMFIVGAVSSIQINPDMRAITLQGFKITWVYEALLASGLLMLIYTVAHVVNLLRGAE